jgi:hypothetical protein
VANSYNPSTQKAEIEASLGPTERPVSKKKRKKKKRNKQNKLKTRVNLKKIKGKREMRN